ncbi:uncharacterized protein HHUB_1302 [Halobacterium hubeiense]|uniref:Uncharacterized protein n=1 Tax=Halobacterium hubeiense TaxID=1407499 RepID=A0A0U5GYL9_9EURY|nr:uncharacterized protein HHUB_1302 [Halobacterium hubeiense]
MNPVPARRRVVERGQLSGNGRVRRRSAGRTGSLGAETFISASPQEEV